MRKIVALVLVSVLLMALCACGASVENVQDASDTTVQNTQKAPIGETVEKTAEPAAAPAEAKAYEVTYTKAVAWTNSIGTSWVQVIVEITNTGSCDLYLSSGAYDLEDAGGKLVTSQSYVSMYPDVLAPGEKGYLYDETTLDAAVDGELKVVARPDVKEATVELIRYAVTDAELKDGSYGGLKLLGRVENTSSAAADMVYVVAFLYDDNGVCIGQIFTILTDELAAGAKVGFEMSDFSLPDSVTLDSVASYVIYAYPMQMQF